jgi:xanthine dehydrogenase small subunit
VTVEGIGGETTPGPLQQAMIDCHGSQCGFCTPGFVVAMTGLLEEREELSETCMRHGLTGNLCRCTGYTSIIEAGSRAELATHERMSKKYPADAMISEFAQRRPQSIELEAEWGSRLHLCASPADLETALAFLAEHPDCTIVAGATDVGVRINKTATTPAAILDLNRIAELEGIAIANGELLLGARASWTALEQTCESRIPEFHKMIRVFGAPQIRHVGTIGGNVANASPIADSLPFLHVMEAVVVLQSAGGSREVNINEFYQGYKKLDMRPGELITRLRVPLPKDDELLRLYKVSRRRDLDISTFTAAVRMRLDGETIVEPAIALGGVGPTVIRARKTEDFLRGRELGEETMQQAGDIAAAEITPISDVRGAADYRYQLTRNVLMKFCLEMQAGVAVV